MWSRVGSFEVSQAWIRWKTYERSYFIQNINIFSRACGRASSMKGVNLVYKSYLFDIIAHCTHSQTLLFVVFNFTLGPFIKYVVCWQKSIYTYLENFIDWRRVLKEYIPGQPNLDFHSAYAFIKKSTIFTQWIWNSIKIKYSWVLYFDRVSY